MSRRGGSEHFTENRPQRIQSQWRHRLILNGDQAPAAFATRYDIIPTSSDMKVSYVKFRQTSNAVAQGMQIFVNADGTPEMDEIQAAAQNVWYYVYLSDEEDDIVITNVQTLFGGQGIEYPTQSIRVEYWLTGAGGEDVEGMARVWQL